MANAILPRYVRNGNEKLGRNVCVINRPVGASCPSSCFFLGNGCYAERTENRFPQARRVALRYMRVQADFLHSVLVHASQQSKSVRIHARGDFARKDSAGRSILDVPYIRAWETALTRFLSDSWPRPRVWTYTHLYHKRVAALVRFGVEVYASTHTEADIRKAQRAGFELIAHVLPQRKAKAGSYDAPRFVELPIVGRALVCPEQRLGRKRVTCDRCNYCPNGGCASIPSGHVAFLTH